MSELRWNPLLEEWVITATHRQERPLMPKDSCPFCIGSDQVPPSYEIVCIPNKFPSLQYPPLEPDVKSKKYSSVIKSEGICEVVLYTPFHDTTLTHFSDNYIYKLIKVWTQRYKELGVKKFIKYVYIFENKGGVIGVTLPHPHGQIYAFPYIPPKVTQELEAARKYYRQNKKCIFCDILRDERKEGLRKILENKHFFAFIPFFARWPYEVHLYAKRHLGSLLDLTDEEKKFLAKILKRLLVKYDNLFGFSFPYMMILHQIPTDNRTYDYYHFHIEFYPPYRDRNKLKYLASCEIGAGSFINDTRAEEKAKELRNVSSVLK